MFQPSFSHPTPQSIKRNVGFRFGSIVIAILLLSPFLSICQGLSTFKGQLLDKETKKPIEYATVFLRAGSISTVTNSEGYFVFHIDESLHADSIIFSSLGYKTLVIAVTEVNGLTKIFLEPKVIVLDEVIVSTNSKVMPAREVVKKALAGIKENFGDKFILDGYLRKYQQIDDRYTSYLDAAVQIYDDQFTVMDQKKQAEYIDVLAVRKSFNFNNKGYDNWLDKISNQSNWLARLLADDDVRYQSGLLDNGNTYTTGDYISFNEHECYQILVVKKPWFYLKPGKKSVQSELKLVIDAESFKIYKIIDNEVTTDLNDKTQFSWEKKVNEKVNCRILGGKRTVEFKEHEGKLYLNYVSELILAEDFQAKTGQNLHINEYFWELSINKVTRNPAKKEVNAFSLSKRDDLRMSLMEYNPSFWTTYNIIPLSSKGQKAFADLSKELPVESQFEKSNRDLKNKSK